MSHLPPSVEGNDQKSSSRLVTSPSGPGWRDVLHGLHRPKVLIGLMLGFSSGLPFMLVANTLGLWLRDVGLDLKTIGFLSWIGLAYSCKFLIAPYIDSRDAPIFGRWLGRRRGWLLFTQASVGLALYAMAATDPTDHLAWFGAFALFAAIASASQDVVADAWRIETAPDAEEQGLMTAAYQLGYRSALLVADALILLLAGQFGWPISYSVMALLMGVGIAATLLATEPPRHELARADGPVRTRFAGIVEAVIAPLRAFFVTHKGAAALIVVTVGLYRLPDFIMGPMAGPLYIDLGIAKETIGTVRASIGLWASLAGIALGGLSVVRLGYGRALVLGAILGPGSNLAFTVMALLGGDTSIFAGAIIVDNFSSGFAGTALVAYMSSLTSLGYSATQYALLSSLYAFIGKLLKGFSGLAVESLAEMTDQMSAYAIFFAGTAALGIPTVILCLMLQKKPTRSLASVRGNP